MEDKCQTCEREFRGLEDYPLIYVAGFCYRSVPVNLKFPFYDRKIFVGPNSNTRNKRPPQEVLDFFKENEKQTSYVQQDGWKWILEGEGLYHRENPDQREIIVAELNPYLDSLDGLVGKEVPKSKLLPQFPRDAYFRYAFNIPNTAYKLVFDEQEKTPTGLRITNLEIGEGPNLERGGRLPIKSVATIGRLEYEGRTIK